MCDEPKQNVTIPIRAFKVAAINSSARPNNHAKLSPAMLLPPAGPEISGRNARL